MGIGLDLASNYKIAIVTIYDGYNGNTSEGWLALNQKGDNVLCFDNPGCYHHPFGIDRVFNSIEDIKVAIINHSAFKKVTWCNV